MTSPRDPPAGDDDQKVEPHPPGLKPSPLPGTPEYARAPTPGGAMGPEGWAVVPGADEPPKHETLGDVPA